MHGNTKNLLGRQFGRLIVIEKATSDKNSHARWTCRCDCGKEKIVAGTNLLTGKTTSCGCYHSDRAKQTKHYTDLTGQIFGRLTVISFAGIEKNGDACWECLCECGSTKTVKGGHLMDGSTKSCGCLNREPVSHGLLCGQQGNLPRLYRIWQGMKQRCYNSNRGKYPNYGGRGITVCPEWKNDYEAFYRWAKTHGYRDDLTIDRIDNDGPYCPENCRWITSKENTLHRWESAKSKAVTA